MSSKRSSRCRRSSISATSSAWTARTSRRARTSAIWRIRSIADIRAFKAKHGCDRLVMIWCGSTEVYMKQTAAHATVASFEKALEQSDDAIPSSMVYAYAAIREGLPFANAAPNLTADIPAMLQLAARRSRRSPATT